MTDAGGNGDSDPRTPGSELESRRAVSAALVRLVGRGDGASEGASEGPDESRLEVVRQTVVAVARSARGAGIKALAGGKWLTETLIDTVPTLPVRSAERLREQYPGLSTEEIAAGLVSAAVKASTAVGVAAGALAAVEFAAPPTLLAAPAQLAAETLAVAAIEVKLVAELHEIFGLPAQGGPGDRALAYLSAWAHQKGMDPADPKSVVAGLGAAGKRQLRKRLANRFGRNILTLGPLLTGAVIGGAMNRHETRDLGGKILGDLRVAAAGSKARFGRRR